MRSFFRRCRVSHSSSSSHIHHRLPLLTSPASFNLERVVSTSANGPLPAKYRQWPYYVTVLATAVGTFVAYTSWKDSTLQGILQPESFTSFTIVSKEPLSPTSTIFTLRPTNAPWSEKPYEHLWRQGVWSIQVKQPQLQIARAYTPLPPQVISPGTAIAKSNGLRFLIRKEEGGEVSSYLHKLPFGSTIDLRGPHVEFDIPKDVDEVVFLAGGTGIAPALQVAYTVLGRSSSLEAIQTPRVHILWASRKKEECGGGINRLRSSPKSNVQHRSGSSNPQEGEESYSLAKKNAIVKELEALKLRYPEQFTVDYFIDEDGTFIKDTSIRNTIAYSSATTIDSLAQSTAKKSRKKLMMLSGPDGFISTLAGPKLWEGGKQVQGRLEGCLSRIDLRDWIVWKL